MSRAEQIFRFVKFYYDAWEGLPARCRDEPKLVAHRSLPSAPFVNPATNGVEGFRNMKQERSVS